MGLEDVVDAVEHVESLLADEETGPVQDSLSWQQMDADVQLGKACAMLGTCRQLQFHSSRLNRRLCATANYTYKFTIFRLSPR
jgi:hypothetical protein